MPAMTFLRLIAFWKIRKNGPARSRRFLPGAETGCRESRGGRSFAKGGGDLEVGRRLQPQQCHYRLAQTTVA